MLRDIGYTPNAIETMSPARVRYYRQFYSVEAKANRAAAMAAMQNRIWDDLNAPNQVYARLEAQWQQRPQAARDLNLENLNDAVQELERINMRNQMQLQQMMNPRPGQAFNVQDVWTVRQQHNGAVYELPHDLTYAEHAYNLRHRAPVGFVWRHIRGTEGLRRRYELRDLDQ